MQRHRVAISEIRVLRELPHLKSCQIKRKLLFLNLFPELLRHPPSGLCGQGFQKEGKNDAKDIFLHLGHRALEALKLFDTVKYLVEQLERLAILLLAQCFINPPRR